MKNIKKTLVGLAAAALLSSCTVSYPGWATNNATGSKTGVAERKVFLGILIGETDLSQTTAAKNGGITKIATVDYSVTGGIFSKTYRVTVTGE